MNSLPHRDPDAVDAAERALRDFAGENVTAYQAMNLLEHWVGRHRLAAGQWREVIRRFPGPIQEASHGPGG